MMSRSVLILPQAPVSNANYMKLIPPIIASYLSLAINGEFYYCINLLDTFNDRVVLLGEYLDHLNRARINYDDLWIDSKHIDELLENVYQLIARGYIRELETTLYRCPCGKIEIEEAKIESCNPNNTDFCFNNGQMLCKSCNSVCQKSREKILAFFPNGIKREDIVFLPDYLNSDAKTYENTILNSHIAVSRKRNTGIQIIYNNIRYNIDVDFLWSTYLACFEEEEKVVVSGNRVSYQLFVVGLIERILKPDNNTILLGIPIISNVSEHLNDDIDPEIVKLALSLNMRWNCKKTNFDVGILRKLYKSSPELLTKIFQRVTSNSEPNIPFREEVAQVMNNNFNSQKVLKKVMGGER